VANSKVIVVIPSYNDLAPLGKVAEAVSKVTDVLIVDDGSKDGTDEWLKASKFRHLSHETNLGYDAALVSGLAWAATNGYELAITFDADGQHKISDLESVINALQNGGALVIPYRVKFARFSEKLYAFITRNFLGVRDPMSGLKGYDLRHVSVEEIQSISGTIGFGLALKMRLKGLIPIQFSYEVLPRHESTPSFGGLVRGNVRIIKGLLKTIEIMLICKGSRF
jgi:glycosyltransferase involved in cell wall biosynthesis